jgi:hypothetical protein
LAQEPLDPGEIITAAGFATGHFNVLDAGFTARLAKFTEWLNEHGNLSAEQALTARGQILQIVITRLLLEVDRKRLAAIAGERIERPIFVIGYSRTGTSLLHSLLALDPAHQGPLWWHTHQPSPPPGEMPVARGRIEAAQRELDSWNQHTPGLLTLHPYWDDGVNTLIEDEEIHTIDFQNVYPTLLFRIPALAIMNLGETADPRACYAFQKKFLQHLQWNMPARRWVLKGCAHQFQLKDLFAGFPDAICIWPHRDPVDVHQSTLAISSALYHAITNGRMDWQQFARGYLQATRAGIDRVLADPLVDDRRIVHLRFKDLSKDPVATIKRIYSRFNLAYSDEFEQRMRAWLDDPGHRSDRYGRYPYSLEPFGLKREDVARLFADYGERFGLI